MESNRNDPKNKNPNPQGDNPKKGIGPALIIALALVLLFSWIYNTVRNSQYTQTTLSDFYAAKDAGQLAEVEFQYDRILYMTKEEAAKEPSQQKASYTGFPSGGDLMALAEELIAEGVTTNSPVVEDNSMIMMVLYYAIMFAVLFFFKIGRAHV